ncbi:MAG TPA: hypothetical protein VMW38_13175, partial [Terriglobia bacterium]|nr:hypothetical protein [Terriglobia bacterium]
QAREKADAIAKAAAESVGLTAVGKTDRARLTMYLEELKRADARRKLLEREIKELVKEIPLAQYILSLPGMGAVSCGICDSPEKAAVDIGVVSQRPSLYITTDKRVQLTD